MSARKKWKSKLWQHVMLLVSPLGVEPNELRKYVSFAREVRDGEPKYCGLMLQKHARNVIEDYVKKGLSREVLRHLTLQMFCLMPAA